MADLDRVKPTLTLSDVTTVLDTLANDVVPRMNEAWLAGDAPESDLLAVQWAQQRVRRAVTRSHRARKQAAARPPGPRLTEVEGFRWDPSTGQITADGPGKRVYVFARPDGEEAADG